VAAFGSAQLMQQGYPFQQGRFIRFIDGLVSHVYIKISLVDTEAKCSNFTVKLSLLTNPAGVVACHYEWYVVLCMRVVSFEVLKLRRFFA
jgi:hypothetical protein